MQTNPRTSVSEHDRAQTAYFDGLAETLGQNETANVDKFAVIDGLIPTSDRGPRIIECGGGAGFYTRHLLTRGHDVTCVDLSADALMVNAEKAAEQGTGDRLATVRGDFAEYASGTSDRFDTALFIKVLHHFDSFGAIEEALDAARACVRPGGRIVIFEPNGRNPMWEPYYRSRKAPGTNHSKWHYERNLSIITKPHFDAYLTARGLEHEWGFHYVVPAMVLSRRIPAVTPALRAINRGLERTPLASWAANLSLTISC